MSKRKTSLSIVRQENGECLISFKWSDADMARKSEALQELIMEIVHSPYRDSLAKMVYSEAQKEKDQQEIQDLMLKLEMQINYTGDVRAEAKKQGARELAEWIELQRHKHKYPECPVCGTNMPNKEWQAKIKELGL